MKKGLITLVLILAALSSSCHESPTRLNGMTTTIIPPSMAKPSLTVMLPSNGNSVLFYVYFIVNPANPLPQTVAIGQSAPLRSGGQSGPPAGLPVLIQAPATVQATATINGMGYSNVTTNLPVSVSQTFGWNVSTYSDTSGNQAIIAVAETTTP